MRFLWEIMGFQFFFFFFLKRNGVKWTEIIRKSNFFSLFRVFSRSGMKGLGLSGVGKYIVCRLLFLVKIRKKREPCGFAKTLYVSLKLFIQLFSRFFLGLSTLKFFVSKVVVWRWLRVFNYMWCHWAIPIILSRGKLFHRPNPSFPFYFSAHSPLFFSVSSLSFFFLL